ncbi:hypothetical protein QQ020_07935 [Fulvivirgaceae bacterium BMA12]|uniref:Deoxyribose-phosphate aldolase n=1 Tax=Agaribacillus aureus TaxID=3051825 RepID=A0ABT8L4L6_9BACT|nr:hypothetical protein [Fulvivirgaceae bacterium BMA12]
MDELSINRQQLSQLRTIICVCMMGVGILSCSEKPDPQVIIDKAIKKHGGEHYDNVLIAFDFRGRHYTILKKDTWFEYTRSFEDSLGKFKDVLNNDGFYRLLNGEKFNIPDTMAAKYARSVNSVAYFAMTPFVLNDEAVKKRYVGMCSLKDQKYHKIEISFEKVGGGEDYNDVFVYWINKDTYTMDYFAYAYEVDGGGTRFREIYNRRRVGDILFTDHVNYKYTSEDTPLSHYDQLYEDNQLTKLSHINLENVTVTPAD